MRKIRLNLRKVIAIVICLAGMTTFTQAQTPVTINVSTLGGTDANNNAASTESHWEYTASSKRLALMSTNGTYTLTGTNADLYVDVTNANANVTLNGADISFASTSTTVFRAGSTGITLTLIGENRLTSSTQACLRFSDNFTITSSSGGSLTAKGFYSAIFNNGGSAVNLIISGNADVTAEGTGTSSSYGLQLTGGGSISVSANAKLKAKGSSSHGIFASSPLTLNANGVINAEATGSYYGISADSLLITGTGSIGAKGRYGISGILELSDCDVTTEGTSMIAISTSSNIKMNDAAKLTMKNGINSDETHTFEASDSASTYEWKLTNAATTDSLTNAVISVTVAAGQSGTVERVNPITYTITVAAGTGGSINPSGVVTVNAGTDQPFTFTANSGYEISQVLIDNLNNFTAVAAGTYTFTNVTANHTIEVSFAPITGISEVTAEKVNIYPNPTTGQLRVSGDIWDGKDREIRISNVVGQVVFTSQLSKLSPETTIDISHLANGLYFLKVGGKMVKIIKE